MNFLKSQTLFILLSIWAMGLKAQPQGYQASLNRMFAENSMKSMQMQMNNMWLFSDYSPANAKYNYRVKMKDSTVEIVSSIIYLDTIRHQNYLLFENKKLPKKDSLRKQRIYPDQTVSIWRRGLKPFSNIPCLVTGTAADSCWMFKAVGDASINIFTFLSVREGEDFLPESVVAIQKGNGPIVRLSPENVTAMVEGDEDALKALEKKNYLKAIKAYNKNFLKAKKAAAKSESQ